MENGLQEFAEQMLATAVVGKDQDVVKVLTSVEVGDDLKDTTMTNWRREMRLLRRRRSRRLWPWLPPS